MTTAYTNEIHAAILAAYSDPYERIGVAVLALALRDATGEHPRLALSARRWLRKHGKSWMEALTLESQCIRELTHEH